MAKVASTFIGALQAIAINSQVGEFEVSTMAVFPNDEFEFTHQQASRITDWIMEPDAGRLGDEQARVYEVSSGDAHIGYIYVADKVYYQTQFA